MEPHVACKLASCVSLAVQSKGDLPLVIVPVAKMLWDHTQASASRFLSGLARRPATTSAYILFNCWLSLHPPIYMGVRFEVRVKILFTRGAMPS